MKIDDSVLQVIDRSTTEANRLVLPEQLDRKMYLEVNKVLAAAGGKWNSRAKAHLFDGSAGDAVEQLLATGEVTTRQEIEFFETPPEVVATLLAYADLEPGMEVLEPSAGQGAIAGPLAGRGCLVDCVERDPHNAKVLREKAIARRLVVRDFLSYDRHPLDTEWDRVVMNPPFAHQADIRHVRHALSFLKPEGQLVSVMSAGAEFRENREAVEFRALVEKRGGWMERLPDDSFKPSGTGVRTVIAVIPGVSA